MIEWKIGDNMRRTPKVKRTKKGYIILESDIREAMRDRITEEVCLLLLEQLSKSKEKRRYY